MITSRDEVARLLDSLGLSSLTESIRSSCWLALGSSFDDRRTDIVSRLGGRPDLPSGTSWPTGTSGPLSFLGQVRLDEVDSGAIDVSRSGLLSIFLDTGHTGAPQVTPDVFVAVFPISDLVRADVALDDSPVGIVVDVFDSVVVRPTTVWSPRFDYRDAQLPRWFELAERVAPRSGNESHLGGHSFPIQEAMEPVCAAMTGSPPSAWTLLAQLDSNRQVGFSWGAGSGSLYLWIDERRLRARDFSEVIAIVQDS